MKHLPPLFALLLLAASPVQAEPTRVMVRAHSTDAKFIGTSMGGVQIVLTDARSGKVLARGMTEGGTGDTKRLVTDPHVRGGVLSDANSAGFEAVLDVDRPTLVKAEARGPMGKPGAAVSVSSTLWVLPGRHLGGDGWVLNFPGLVVEPASVVNGRALDVSAKVTLMCGCPLEAGGTWDANNYAVTARLLNGSREVARKDLSFSGKTSIYAGSFTGVPAGSYTLQVTAADKATINAGVGETKLTMR